VLREQAILTAMMYETLKFEDRKITLVQASKIAHPDRKKMRNDTAERLALRELRCVDENDLWNDKQLVMDLYGLDYKTIFRKTREKMDAKKLYEIVKTVLHKQRIKGKDGKVHVKTYPVTIRNSELVEDNTTQMRAIELASEFRGLRQKTEPPKGGGQNIAVIVLKGAPIQKKRQKRYTGGKSSERSRK
jgi:hypothetical protein